MFPSECEISQKKKENEKKNKSEKKRKREKKLGIIKNLLSIFNFKGINCGLFRKPNAY